MSDTTVNGKTLEQRIEELWQSLGTAKFDDDVLGHLTICYDEVTDEREQLATAERRCERLEAALKKLDDWQCECRWPETCDCLSQIQKIVYYALKESAKEAAK